MRSSFSSNLWLEHTVEGKTWNLSGRALGNFARRHRSGRTFLAIFTRKARRFACIANDPFEVVRAQPLSHARIVGE